jgi:4-amino-4-deoxychorismate lyase
MKINNSFLETIKSIDGELYNLSYHQQRYESVLKSFEKFDFKNLKNYLNPPSDGLYRCRVVYTLDDISVSYIKYKKRNISSLKIIQDNTIEYNKKYLDRSILNDLYDKRGSCDDVLIVKNSFITDTTIANIAFFKDGIWFTPRRPLLNGTTRARLLDMKKIVEADIKVDDIDNYEGIALLNAMIDFDIISKNKLLRDVIC